MDKWQVYEYIHIIFQLMDVLLQYDGGVKSVMFVKLNCLVTASSY
jgi:hypothetical protein